MSAMFSPNDVYVEELYYQYLRDPNSVSPEWQEYFRRNGINIQPNGRGGVSAYQEVPSTPTPSESDAIVLPENAQLELLSGIRERIAQNMTQSLGIPTATSVRSIPIKILEENRLVINEFLTQRRQRKLSYTHIIAWAIVRALRKYPQLNDTVVRGNDGKFYRHRRSTVNLGLAVDTTRSDGTRVLVVPAIKAANQLTFTEFIARYDELIEKARSNKLAVEDLTGTTVTLTNPGMIGTVMSMPRLMEGQGLIIATGSIGYPAEFSAVMPEVLVTLAVSKVMTVTSTYDHRIIQGAESGEFLQYLEQLLKGKTIFMTKSLQRSKFLLSPIAGQRTIGSIPLDHRRRKNSSKRRHLSIS